MSRMVCDGSELEKEVISILEKEKHIILATCSEERVTARSMSHVNIGVDVFFQTDRRFLKVEQIRKNPKVALCVGNLQIEGVAKILGHPSASEQAAFCALYKQKHPYSFKKYAGIKEEVVIKVTPSLITLWKYIDGKPCRDYININEGMAYREFYKIEE